jgi:fructokinase
MTLEMGPKLVVITAGAKGADGYTKSAKIQVPAGKVAVVDTVGAGDTFNAGILASLHDGGLLTKQAVAILSTEQVEAALSLAAQAAAVTVSRAGANPPWRAELRRV